MEHDKGAASSGHGPGEGAGAGVADVLVVDDSAEIREVLAAILRREGHVVAQAANGVEALRHMRVHGRPKVVISDLQMPVMNGWALLHAMERDPALANIPVVVLSAGRKDGPLPVPEERFMQKPIDVDELLAFVRKYGG